ncbi:hypothetical protein H6G54_26290 [Anabaena cylindrica FACHB-243]|uniref:Uncharacterized protein n=1 Tax=Anabaena cylindrica (strain ATCC 27899 / PCC 7122) TaxID=272123 RepID=K9ZE14_ANACC|nr:MULTISPECIES: hypothetical protein [Anabaena]AFZ57453.1 hypothetical protein Anacy_1968 [Anabaena cylindrica PCC 7122]MBD2421134.1 hypothetical protein [Anabaena cylindrica FACHB-243]MBY5281159.1 hypothetical protein [Anabaena sp. CCAP 1446/1C]MBY5308569.1 hypothetical protein [Anabaena sp. CCAP 1446/1C]MCM2405889.1 hypothetical protein [Anabaena sp. CCAP 1446/1C]
MNLSFKDMKFMIEAVDNLIEKYQQRINEIEDLDEYEDEVSDLGNDIMFLSSLRKKIDESLNNSLTPQANTSSFRELFNSSLKNTKVKVITITSTLTNFLAAGEKNP